MLPEKSPRKQRTNKKNNLDLNTLVSHVANLKTSELSNMNTPNDGVPILASQQKIYEKQIIEKRTRFI